MNCRRRRKGLYRGDVHCYQTKDYVGEENTLCSSTGSHLDLLMNFEAKFSSGWWWGFGYLGERDSRVGVSCKYGVYGSNM